MLIAVMHFVGAVVAVFILGAATLVVAEWEKERNRKAAVQEASIALGIPPDEFDDSKHSERIIRFTSDRFSSELFRNRLSDLVGLVSTAWNWIGTAVQVAVLCGVIWYSLRDSQVAIYAWSVPALAIFFWLSSVALALLCKLLTGRYPGQARQARKMLGQLLEARQSSPQVASDEEDDF